MTWFIWNIQLQIDIFYLPAEAETSPSRSSWLFRLLRMDWGNSSSPKELFRDLKIPDGLSSRSGDGLRIRTWSGLEVVECKEFSSVVTDFLLRLDLRLDLTSDDDPTVIEDDTAEVLPPEVTAGPEPEVGTTKLFSESFRFKIGLPAVAASLRPDRAKYMSSELFLSIGLGKTGFWSRTLWWGWCTSSMSTTGSLVLSCKVKDEDLVLTLGFGGSLRGRPLINCLGLGMGVCCCDARVV